MEKCNQCDFACSRTGNLRIYLKIHSGEKPNKCNQCEYASAQASNLRTHLKTHNGEKLNKCNQCDFVSALACYLRTHLKIHSGASVHQPSQATWGTDFKEEMLRKWHKFSGEMRKLIMIEKCTSGLFGVRSHPQMWLMWKYHRNRGQPNEPHARAHIGEKHVVVQITPDMVFLHGGQSYAPSSDCFYVNICYIGYIL